MLYARLQPQLRSSSFSLALLPRFRWPSQPPSNSSTPTSRPYGTASASSLPLVAQSSFWQSVIPKFLRKSQSTPSLAKLQRSKEWNPATYFIIMSLVVGSNAIQMIALKNELRNFSRKADVRIELLQDIIERIGKGEDVNVEEILGTGDEDREREWENVLRDIEQEDRLWRAKDKRRDQKRDEKQSLEQDVHDAAEEKELDSDVSFGDSKGDDLDSVPTPEEAAGGRVAGKPAPGFY